MIARLREGLEARAGALGFDACRIVRPDAIAAARHQLSDWLASGAQGEMDWMAQTFARRADPCVLWPEARSIIMLAMNYGPQTDPLDVLHKRDRAGISVYARHRDYHDLVKGRLKLLGQWLAGAARERLGKAIDLKVFVDTAPVMEKPLAAAAGIGWQGKHSNLVSRDFGSWLFLGSIFTNLELMPDQAETDHCGSCHACLDACPTKAFPAPYQVDARRCISYLTIEHKGHIAPEFRTAMGNRVYGCDDCLAVCPWNKYAQQARETGLIARDDLNAPELAKLAVMDEAEFRAHFSGSAVKRVGHARFLRNLLIAMGNSGSRGLAPLAVARLEHESELVRAMAVWALDRLLDATDFDALRAQHLLRETDAAVRTEWLTGGAKP